LVKLFGYLFFFFCAGKVGIIERREVYIDLVFVQYFAKVLFLLGKVQGFKFFYTEGNQVCKIQA
jgi:hypothetical protein